MTRSRVGFQQLVQGNTDSSCQFRHDFKAGVADARFYFGDVGLSQASPSMHVCLAETSGDSRLTEVFGKHLPFGRDSFPVRHFAGSGKSTRLPVHACRPFSDTIRRGVRHSERKYRCSLEEILSSVTIRLFPGFPGAEWRFRCTETGIRRPSGAHRAPGHRIAANRPARKWVMQTPGSQRSDMDPVPNCWGADDRRWAPGKPIRPHQHPLGPCLFTNTVSGQAIRHLVGSPRYGSSPCNRCNPMVASTIF